MHVAGQETSHEDSTGERDWRSMAAMDVTLPVRREASRLADRAAACSLPVLAWVAPLGLAQLRAVPFFGAVSGVNAALSVSEPVDFAAVALGRVATLFPVGDLTMRLSLLGAVVGALAVYLWTRVGLELAAWLRPPPRARLGPDDAVHEPVAVLGAVAAVTLCGPVLTHYTTASAAQALSLGFVAAWAWAVTLLLRDPADARAALAASFLAGVTAVSAPTVAPLLLPPGLVFWVWGLKRRARWALLGPLAFALGTAPGLGGAAVGFGDTARWAGWFDLISLGVFRRAAGQVGFEVWWQTAVSLADGLGVVAVLLALLGLGVLALRLPSWGGLVLYGTWAGVLSAAGAGVAREARLADFLGFVMPALAAGILHFSAKLGRARLPAALALSLMCLVAPVMSGGLARFGPDGRLPLHLLSRAEWRLPPRSAVDPGSDELRLVFRYGAALGVRPDLVIRPGAVARDAPASAP